MLTVLHPEVITLVDGVQIGLIPLIINEYDSPKLIIKAPKEAILAAKINCGFKIYAVPIMVQNKHTIGFITAFFDNPNEPLVISTPMFNEPGMEDLRSMLLCGKFDVYFFDENNRELLGYTVSLTCESSTRSFIKNAKLLPFNFASARSSLDQMAKWFSLRNTQDDLASVSITLDIPLFPEDILISNSQSQYHSYHGAQSFSYSQLVRQEPGPFQERDIVHILHRVFSPEQIHLGPLRVTDSEEIVDVLVATDSHVLFIQAKDSPNTEHEVQNPISRKKAKAKKSLRKAVGQMRGALRYAKSTDPMRMLSGGKEIELTLTGRALRALIIVKELFNDEYSSYSPTILSLTGKTHVPCIALDYPELQIYTSNFKSEKLFFEAYDVVFANGIKNGIFPRIRLGVSG